jgi:hypothetical protein
MEFLPIFAGRELGQCRQHGRSDRGAEQRLGNLHDHPAIRERRYRADLVQPRGDVVTSDDDQLDPEHGQQPWTEQFQCPEQTCVT